MKFFNVILVLTGLIGYTGQAYTQMLPAIIPQPVNVQVNATAGSFLLALQTVVCISDSSLNRSANFLTASLLKYHNLNLNITNHSDPLKKNGINLILDKDKGKPNSNGTVAGIGSNPNQYTLTSNAERIEIRANTPQAIFYGIQTLLQLLPVQVTDPAGLKVASVEISDYPRFGYRGMHLDVSRHYFDLNFIKKYIDYLALHKLNYFHWHLTDDHGWRIEIKKHPKLTDIGAWRNGTIIGLYPGTGNDGLRYGGYYTQEEVKEVVRYAADRYITVVPEIEMPGHSMGVLAAYPELGTTPEIPTRVAQTWGIFNKFNNVLQPTEQTFSFLEDVLTEVMQLFPSPYIHIGGDECAKIWWKQSPLSQKIIREKGLKDENGLQSYFIHRMEKFVNTRGRTIIGWDEILDGGLAPNAIVMSWRGEKGGIAAAKQKHKVIMTPENSMYFNHAQFLKEDSLTAPRYVPLKNVYDYEPVPAVLTAAEAQYIWGAQGNLWSEYIASPAKAEYQLFPRLDALSEVLWSPKNKRNFADFQKRLKTQLKRYDLMKINYSTRYLSN
ncbi:beta-hexosaminidase precursor [Pedobacter sp. BAL39]|uniref:beta-N-acetylhexosaminidase n=1 Tax=Pedobacter sp. BAL39 TaxID=391596 RepID=UPI0001559753|nr:beta-N-acetylhexosaminidase [Pedobacter sp. BAL39]EDM35743.1 beta-hexosaminidase precursor [Pedobacter sp. BAL39]